MKIRPLLIVLGVTLFGGWLPNGSASAQSQSMTYPQKIAFLTQEIDDLRLTEASPSLNTDEKRLYFNTYIRGAYLLNRGAAGVIWYFSNLGFYAAVLDGQHNLENQEYLTAYLANTTEPGFAVKDYEDVINSLKTKLADSDDSYASTLLTLASHHATKGGGQQWFSSNLPLLKALAKANLLDAIDPELKLTKTFNSASGRAETLPDDKKRYQHIMQFMDNCESVRGLSDFAGALPSTDKDKGVYTRAAQDVALGVKNQFVKNQQAFKWRADLPFSDSNQNLFYPGRLCQIFPQAYGVNFGADTKQMYDAGWAYLNARGDKWWEGEFGDKSVRIDNPPDGSGKTDLNFPHMIIGYVAALRGNYADADAQLTYFLNKIDNVDRDDIDTDDDLDRDKNELPFANISELGWALRTARLLSKQKTGLSVDDVAVREDKQDKVANFHVTLFPASTQPVTVSYTTANGSAQAPGDYTAQSGQITFAPGETSKPISVPIIEDSLDETNETFNLNLSSVTSTTIADGSGIGTIINDDFKDSTKPTVLISNPGANQQLSIASLQATGLRGSATDNFGVASVFLKLFRVRGGVRQFWNGTNFGSTSAEITATVQSPDVSSTTWFKEVSDALKSALDSGVYGISAYATDRSGNVSPVVSHSFTLTAQESNVAPSLLFVKGPDNSVAGTSGSPQTVPAPLNGQSPANSYVTFITKVRDVNGNADMGKIMFVLGSGPSELRVIYNGQNNLLYAQGPNGTSQGVVPGSANTLTVSSGALDSRATSIVRSGNDLTISWRLKITSTSTVKHSLRLRAQDKSGALSAVLGFGTWTFAPTASGVTVTSSGGS